MRIITQSTGLIGVHPQSPYTDDLAASESSYVAPQGLHSRDQIAPLGTNAKSSSPLPPLKCEKTLKIQTLRVKKYALQNVIRNLIMKVSGFSDSVVCDFEAYNQLHRVVKCERGRIADYVEVKKSVEYGKAFYCNLFTCGSVWACPICASKIQERRREEISQALEWAQENNLMAVMVTLTFPHYEFQTVDDLLVRQSAALKYLRSGKSFQNFKEKVGMKGFIRSLEVTYGRNGWHPHTHELWFIDPSIDKEGFEAYINNRWEKACDKQGLIPRGKLKAFRAQAVNYHWNAKDSDYLAKQDSKKNFWGADREMALSSYKRSHKTIHPFELVQFVEMGYEKAGDKFLEYIKAMKGKAQLYWSQGLKDLVELEDLSDEELNDKQEDQAIDVAEFDMWGWNGILEMKARAKILNLAEEGGRDAIDKWLEDNNVKMAARIPVGIGFSSK